VTDQDLDGTTIERDEMGRQKLAAAKDLGLLASSATLAQVIAAYNRLIQKLKGL
jgi:hypothetical protein